MHNRLGLERFLRHLGVDLLRTGSNSGIGKEIAQFLATKGAHTSLSRKLQPVLCLQVPLSTCFAAVSREQKTHEPTLSPKPEDMFAIFLPTSDSPHTLAAENISEARKTERV